MTKGNDLAFATINDHCVGSDGLTKREYFAAMAMQGLLAADNQGKAVASMALEAADDLIEALNKESK